MSTSFSQNPGEGGDFQEAFESLTYGKSTFSNKRLPALVPAPAIPVRSGASPRVSSLTTPSSGGGVDMTLAGSKTVTSTDGLITLFYPESVTVVIGAATLTIPAIIKTP